VAPHQFVVVNNQNADGSHGAPLSICRPC
jgi:hypothetical protein